MDYVWVKSESCVLWVRSYGLRNRSNWPHFRSTSTSLLCSVVDHIANVYMMHCCELVSFYDAIRCLWGRARY